MTAPLLSTAPTPLAAGGKRRVHPMVRINYVLRVLSYGVLLPVTITFYLPPVYPLWVYAGLSVVMLAFPHIGYRQAIGRADQKAGEVANILGDAVMVGVAVALSGMQPWCVLVALIFVIPTSLNVGGIWVGVATAAVHLAVATLVYTLWGPGLILESSLATVSSSMLVITVFASTLAMTNRSTAKKALARGRLLSEQKEQLETSAVALREATEEAEAARAIAQSANQTKSEFLANMSHELRTPLNAIIGYSEMLIDDAEDDGADELVPDLQKIRTAGRHLLGLINDVLDLSKVEAGRMDVHAETFDVAQMIEGVVATIRPLVDTNGNALVVEAEGLPGTMRSDVTKVRQILLNLLSNASKFTSDGTVTLSGTVEGDTVVFRVADTGIGMTPEQLGRLFQPFVQAETSTTRKYGGTGLGLTISRRFAELLGGDVAVDSVEGEGTVFSVRLLLDAEATPAPFSPRAARAVAETAPLVLVIDDDPSSRDILVQTLQRSGLRTAEAADGQSGLDRARELRPALITLDVLMPGLDGWDVLRALKADPATAAVPVVIATISDERGLGYALGAAAYLTKPFERDDLVRSVREHLSAGDGGLDGDILVVEDDAHTRDLLRRGLEREGWTVLEAATVGEALAVVDRARPSLVILDLLLPDGTGFDVFDALGSGVPVIVLTATDLSAADRARLEGGVEHVFQKGRAAQTDILAEVRRLLPVPASVAAGEFAPVA